MSELPFFTRAWFAWLCFFKVFFDARFAARIFAMKTPSAHEAGPDAEPTAAPRVSASPRALPPKDPPAPAHDAALQLLSLLQREGRFVDFLEQDITSFPDAEIGAAARVVHEGCRKAIRGHTKLAPVRSEEEGAQVTVALGFNPAEVKLSGNLRGSAPFTGTLRHRGWRASDLSLPVPVQGHDASIVAPAEVEL